MPTKCFYKPNRRDKRLFTETDAGRILLRAIEANPDFDFNKFFDYLQLNAGVTVSTIIKTQFQQRFLDPVLNSACDRVIQVRAQISNALFRLIGPVRYIRIAYGFIVGFVADLENFEIKVLRVTIRIPDTLLQPIRDFRDEFGTLIERLDILLSEVTDGLSQLDNIC